MAGFASDDNQRYLDTLYVPCLRRAGGVEAAAMLSAPDALCLFNTRDRFRTDRIAAGFAAVRASLRIERGPLTVEQVFAWLGTQ
jgi:hypothetical protein